MASYIENSRFQDITDRTDDATEGQLQRASMLLDVRCGLPNHVSYSQKDDLLLLDYDNLNARRKEAVAQWVAWMTASLIDNDNSVHSVEESITLGRFSVTEGSDENELMPDELRYADEMVRGYNLVRRGVDSHPYSLEYHDLEGGVVVN